METFVPVMAVGKLPDGKLRCFVSDSPPTRTFGRRGQFIPVPDSCTHSRALPQNIHANRTGRTIEGPLHLERNPAQLALVVKGGMYG